MHEKRKLLLEIARSEVGRIHDPEEYGFSPGMHWCGAFALECLHQAGLARHLEWQIGKGFLYKLRLTTSPKPGDMVYFHRKQHHAILVELDEQKVHTVDGNQLGGRVLERVRDRREVGGYYSIEELLDERKTGDKENGF